MNITMKTSQGKDGANFDLPDEFFNLTPNISLLNQVVLAQLAAARQGTQSAKTRSEVSGGGKKPWAQKGKGGARAGSRRSPIFVGGAVAHGPNTGRNYDQKINKKQKKLALKCALDALATAGKLFIVDSIEVPSGKTKDAKVLFDTLNVRDALLVKKILDENTYLAFRNIASTYVVEENELNAFLAATYRSVVIEKAVWENLTKES